MELTNYIACICEGAAEQAIIDLLLDADKLIFTRDQLLEETTIRCRSARNFEERYLRKEFSEKVTVLRILDSRRERFRISKAYKHQVQVINIITAPEVEMLVIFNENAYTRFKKSRKKASEFCKSELRLPSVKSYEFVSEYFRDVDTLIDAIGMYRRISQIKTGEYCLADLIPRE
jgi:hypothetical protein